MRAQPRVRNGQCGKVKDLCRVRESLSLDPLFEHVSETQCSLGPQRRHHGEEEEERRKKKQAGENEAGCVRLPMFSLSPFWLLPADGQQRPNACSVRLANTAPRGSSASRPLSSARSAGRRRWPQRANNVTTLLQHCRRSFRLPRPRSRLPPPFQLFLISTQSSSVL